jgi:hypothetical protein
MNSGQTVFRQLLQFLPRHDFNLCVQRYRGYYRSKAFQLLISFCVLPMRRCQAAKACVT